MTLPADLAAAWIPRSAWGAQQPRYDPGDFSPAPLGIALHWTGIPKADPLHWPRCYQQVAGVQKYHQQRRRWDDIGYNVVVCNHGFAFEGKGWDRRPTAQGVPGDDDDENADHFAVAWIGGPGDTPHPAAVRTIGLVIDHAAALGFPRTLRPHSYFKTTACPGPAILDLIAAGAWNAPSPPAEPIPTPDPPPADRTPILAPASVTLAQLQEHARQRQDTPRYRRALVYAVRHSLPLGVDPAVPAAIMEHETAGGRFGQVVPPTWNNWGGIKITAGGDNDDPDAHARFPDDETGVLAVVQHAALYAGLELADPIADPRHFGYLRGRAEYLEAPGWSWAGSDHGRNVARRVARMRLA